MTCPGDGGLLKWYPDSSINLYVSGSNPLLVCTVGRLLSGCFKAVTICWCVSLSRLQICAQLRRTGMASKAARVLYISPKEFSCLLSDSSSTSKHEVILTVSLSKTLTGEDLSHMAGYNKLCSCRTKRSKLPNLMRDNPLVWHEMWYVSTTSSKSKIIVPSSTSCMMRFFRVTHFSRGWLTILW